MKFELATAPLNSLWNWHYINDIIIITLYLSVLYDIVVEVLDFREKCLGLKGKVFVPGRKSQITKIKHLKCSYTNISLFFCLFFFGFFFGGGGGSGVYWYRLVEHLSRMIKCQHSSKLLVQRGKMSAQND